MKRAAANSATRRPCFLPTAGRKGGQRSIRKPVWSITCPVGRASGSLDTIFGDSELAELLELVLGAPPIAQRLRSEITVIDNVVQRFSDGNLDLGTAASFGLLWLAALQLVVGLHVSGAVSLAWHAAELARRSRKGEPIGTSPD